MRAVGLTGTALASEDSDLLPTFAALHSTAAVARQARFLVHHRLTIPDLMEGSLWGVSTELASARATMAMEAWSMSVLMPAAFAKRRFTTILPILALPCLILASHGPGVELMEPYLDLAAGRMAFCTAVMALVVLFLGGFPTMVLVIGLGQLLIWIHKLDTLKL
uniref:Uncharacterized protein n=1 Tax=Pyrodinium bahamense TaxID=73915 RepID=A0A7S0A572_9DINO